LQRYGAEAISPKRVKAMAERDLKVWTARGATVVAIYSHKEEKLYEWQLPKA
jgi:K+/H+ antiporter YhaU regulatory subunit KhtT